MEYSLKELKVSDIKPDKNQPRKSFDDEKLQLLAENIMSNGLLNPIEVDENYIITDGERRWKAHKLAGIKTITARVVKTKDKTDKLRRQLIFTLQDEEIPTEEKYSAIVRLYKLSGPDKSKNQFSKELGISHATLSDAFQYCNFVEEEPEIAKTVAPHIIIETASLPIEERKEVLKEFEGTKDKKKDLIRELVRDKREKIQLQKNLEEIKKTKDLSLKITTTEEQLKDLKEKISNEIHNIGKLMSYIGAVRRTKLYLKSPKEKESFFKFIEGSIERVEKWADNLRNLKDNLEFEIIKE